MRYCARKGRKRGSRTSSFSRPSAGGGLYLPEPLDVFFWLFLLPVDLGRGDLRRRRHGGQDEEDGGELEKMAHLGLV